MDIALLNADKKQQNILIKPPKNKEPSKSFYQYMKKSLPKLNIGNKVNSGKPLPEAVAKTEHNLLILIAFEEQHQIDRKHKTVHKKHITDHIVKKNQYRNYYSRSISNRSNYSKYNRNCSYSNPRIRNYSDGRSIDSSNNRSHQNFSNNRYRNSSNNLSPRTEITSQKL